MEPMKDRQAGFTVTEGIIMLAILLGVGFFIYGQWQYFSMTNRNEDRKTAVNSLHYYLTEVYYPKHKAYPVMLSPENVNAISKDAFTDPLGRPITDPRSDLRYDPSQCDGSSCESYTLRANLEQAEDFIRESGSN